MVLAVQMASAATIPPFSRLGFGSKVESARRSTNSAAHGRQASLQLSSFVQSCKSKHSLTSAASLFGMKQSKQFALQRGAKARIVAEMSPVLKDKASASESEKKAAIKEAEKPDFKESFSAKKADRNWDSKDKSEADEEISIGPDGYVAAAGKEPVSIAVTTLPSEQGKIKKIRGQEVLAFDYGFQATFLATGTSVPGNVIDLALTNFAREWKALRRNVRFTQLSNPEEDDIDRGPVALALAYTGRFLLDQAKILDRILTKTGLYAKLTVEGPAGNAEMDELRKKLSQLKLSNDKVWERERSRPAVEAPWYILGPYYFLCLMLDVIFNGRPIQRFWFLETVARMPYFSYISMLHLYETLGWWRVGAEVRKVHFAEEWNEMHHLKIMESLGGDNQWVDRFFGQHAAFFYYWILNFLFLVSPKVAYNFSELIEFHAVDTYEEFAEANKELLMSLPPSPVAVEYYRGEDLYMFDEFQTSRRPATRRPKVENLYDVFCNIRDDEFEHVKTMVACQDGRQPIISPNRVKATLQEEG
eukprot:TRINITY_DN18943_c0_g1_i1.p1 TRINITY_DN18943_c0_g1~~TRINITY_DN18943_c0_g1_i1.p1  ORF type:complete len:531 (-),score=170.70 TRINITY_DN18943_c0_g1_i1:460-2052(-)